MKSMAAFALVILACVPARAQQQPAPRQSIEQELLELEQEVDKTILREALLLQGRMSMKVARSDSQPGEKRQDIDTDALREVIAQKKQAIIARSAELTKSRMASRRATPPIPPAMEAAPSANQEIIEKIENARVETQLLQTQVTLLQQSLNKAINDVATAEFGASSDETQRAKAEAARKEYEKVKAKFVEQSKRLQSEQRELQSMQQKIGMGGFGGGFR